MDVKNVFNEELKEEIFINQPEGCVDPSEENKKCR